MKVVSPYRPFPPESASHKALGAFNWVEALQMLRVSVRESCGWDTFALTDVDSPLPVPAFSFVTTERRLMLWILEVSCCYLESEAFDDDTFLISPDALVCRDLTPYAEGDLGLVIRPVIKYIDRPMLNAVQFWAVAAKPRLIAFYRQALTIAKGLSEPWHVWGADTEALRQLVAPLTVGMVERHGLDVHFMDADGFLGEGRWDAGRGWHLSPVTHFKTNRKRQMRAAFNATFRLAVLV